MWLVNVLFVRFMWVLAALLASTAAVEPSTEQPPSEQQPLDVLGPSKIHISEVEDSQKLPFEPDTEAHSGELNRAVQYYGMQRITPIEEQNPSQIFHSELLGKLRSLVNQESSEKEEPEVYEEKVLSSRRINVNSIEKKSGTEEKPEVVTEQDSVISFGKQAADALHCQHSRCQYLGRTFQGFDEYLIDGNSVNILKGEEFLDINCERANVLESPALPRADVMLNLSSVSFSCCPLPTGNVSLAAVLDALNINLIRQEPGTPTIILDSLYAEPPLAAKHLVGLKRLSTLRIFAYVPVHPERDFLIPLQGLQSLVGTSATLDVRALDEAPQTLNELHLQDTETERLPATIYLSPKMRKLTISCNEPFDAVAVPSGLRELDLESPATTLRLDTAPALVTLSLSGWAELRPPPLANCSSLLKVQLTSPAVMLLPDGWLANCSRLEDLEILYARSLTTLPPMLFGIPNKKNYKTKRVAFKQGALETLPEGLLGAVDYLRILELDGNRLQTISADLPIPVFIEEINASFNDLDEQVVALLSNMYSLTVVNLSHNPRLGDVCGDKGYSPLSNSTTLKKLLLKETNVTRICRDWRENLIFLKNLDLSYTSVSKLSFMDLQFKRQLKSEVLLMGAPVVVIEATHEDFNTAAHAPSSDATVRLDSSALLQCDCRMYWTRRTLDRSRHSLAHVSKLSCVGGRQLRELQPEDMVCERQDECAVAALPAKCACSVRPDDDPSQARVLVRVRCEHADLSEVPRPKLRDNSTQRLYELLLAHNRIASLYANDLHDVKGLDLRNNSLISVEEDTAMRLGQMDGVLRLAGNPLECSCRAASLLRALHSRGNSSSDLDNATCSDGSALDVAPTEDCPSPVTWIAGALAALFALTVTACTVCLASRERRFFVQAVLHRWGFHIASKADDVDRRYDAFVTFSHKDEAPILELMARLEPDYRLCVHYRDWTPGLRIPDQIVESVHESHRTLAFISNHFLNSMWTRAEFREAHAAAMLDARPRLVVVLLEDPSALEMDNLLRRYVATHTYLRWGEPWFWDKLAVALPRPRQPKPAEPRADSTPRPNTLLALPALVPAASRAPTEPVVEHPTTLPAAVRTLTSTQLSSSVPLSSPSAIELTPLPPAVL